MENEGQVQGVALGVVEKAKERSKKASKSRMSGRNGLGPHKHRARSRSYAKVGDLLKEKTENASYIDGSFVDERAKQISEGFEKNVADLLEDENH
uniref:En/Spm-like transposon protein n=1 Tax=Arabidopsis thaliana TaxID=3702 RepID=Q9SKI9_ARATH|nr:En/Spm-like transposon protein [Arabidopsis thaliana]